MTIKLVGTTSPASDVTDLANDVADLDDALAARFEKLEAALAKVKDDTDGALLMLEGRIHAIESVNAVAHELPEKPAKKAKP
jgi:hypothetical protein